MIARNWKRKTKEEIIMKRPIAPRRRGWVCGGRGLGGGSETDGGAERGFEVSQTDRVRSGWGLRRYLLRQERRA